MSEPLPKLVQDLLADPETPIGIIRDAMEEYCPERLAGDFFIVRGSTGELGIKKQWDVARFVDGHDAANLLCELNEWCRKVGVDPYGRWWQRGWPVGSVRDLVCPLDPQFCIEVPGVRYYLNSTPLCG